MELLNVWIRKGGGKMNIQQFVGPNEVLSSFLRDFLVD